MYNRNMIRIMKFAVRLLACLCMFVPALSCTNQLGKRSFLNRRGRGSEEYLQVSDFDVDVEGGIWVLDGQKDVNPEEMVEK